MPSVANALDARRIEVGVRFRPDQNGTITAIRFFKGSKTAYGWQEALLSPPVTLTAGETYVASSFTASGNYALDFAYFSFSAHDNPPLHALRDGDSGRSGLYLYTDTPAYPTNTFRGSNYCVDVVFTTGGRGTDTTPPMITGITATASGDGSATISWTTNEPGDHTRPDSRTALTPMCRVSRTRFEGAWSVRL